MDVKPVLILGCIAVIAVVGACSSSSTSTLQPPSCQGVAAPDTCPMPAPSWKNQVEPLIEKYCWQCHADGGIDYPAIDLSSYVEVKKLAVTVLQQVDQCLMPNFGATPPPKAYPTVEERNTILAWAGVCMAPNN